MSGRSRLFRLLAMGLAATLAALALLVWLALWWFSPAPVSGRLVAYHSGSPVADAIITVSRQGWGRSESHGQLMWDKRYVATATTDADGRFRLPLPGPVWLVGSGGGRLKAEAEGFQTLDVSHVPPGAELTLQTVVNRDERLPGGTAYLGWGEVGEPFGWSFIDDTPTRDLPLADLYPLELNRAPLRVTLAVPDGGGLHFVSAEEQGIAHDSWDYLLRYLDASPEPPSATRLALDDTPGTLFLRTPQDRYAKLAWEPATLTAMTGAVPGLDATSERLLSLRFVYRPFPGRELPYQPPLFRVESVRAALQAELHEEGETLTGPRVYRVVVTDAEGKELERQQVELTPGVPVSLPSCADDAPLSWRFESLRLEYDEEGLPRLQLTMDGATFVHHSAPMLVGLRGASVFEVMAFDTDYQRHDLEVRLRELNSEAESTGCQ
ncbi:carboxypeptidase-like regulatory domain-containing protein [Halomonas sp. LR5S13]|uniref:carboxypeptidase-like regulatory domain-containing protein n=1 Tax=Halomonas rhizosphaerae TaxID=3043296 RepID=UPI0024A889FE|nr:carboxypeptidase-like regulatory domain-containing protein [Halomonas rhizosphaerae]MDI5920732.1 carboxypeptidase-like regulatory domain-containing protein [Halomonas rhizosphaerae]